LGNQKANEDTPKQNYISENSFKTFKLNVMKNVIIVEQLDSQKAEEIAQAVSDLSKAKGSKKQLPLVLNNTNGDYKLAINLAKKIHASKVDLMIEAHGTLDSAGTILAAAGGERHASVDTVFSPFEKNTKSVRTDRLSPKNQSVLATLGTLNANRRRLKTLAPKAEDLSAFEAKALNIIDKVDSFKSKYPREDSKKKKSFKKSSVK